ncbi:MAG: cysteine desulfurase [Alphaproteobacteria bacterium]|nr:cysteine desulfurase [Alphaproteobacteria bacterium]
MDDPVYLDFNATTPVDPDVVEAMQPFFHAHFGNPSSGHVFGLRARNAVDRAREEVAALLNADAQEIFFTSGGTEANNITILGTACANEVKGRMLHSAIEHPSVTNPCRFLALKGWAIQTLPVDEHGIVSLAAAENALDAGIALLSVMHANNETGSLQPIRELTRLAHAKGIMTHCDAAQSIAKLPIDVKELGIDALSLAGHKMYAPKGIGALYISKGAPIAPINFGGGQERGIRPGTENVALIVGLGKACALAAGRQAEDAKRLWNLKDRLWSRLLSGVPGLSLNGSLEISLPNTLNVSFPAVAGNALLNAAPAIAASTGSACHDGKEAPSSVLTAMGLNRDRALGAVRLTLGRTTTEKDIDAAANALVKAWRQLAG